jgi:diphthine-ammonia ligase
VKNKRAAILWTGGKDCNLALYEAIRQGYEIVALVSFIRKNMRFKAHSLEIIKAQAAALGYSHKLIEIAEPYELGYENAIREIQSVHQVDTIVTGDISEVNGRTNWITERCQVCGLNAHLPLWHMNRENLLVRLFSLGFEIIFSCIKQPWFTIDWLGRKMDLLVLPDLKQFHYLNSLDICGEEGEFHTLVLDGPLYRERLKIKGFTMEKEGPIMYMDSISFTKELKIENISKGS